MYICYMSTYKETIERKKYYVILEKNDVKGVFGNLKRACEFMQGKDFPSYWTLVRKKMNRFDYKEYSLQIIRYQ